MIQRSSHSLRAVAYEMELETRARCQDDNHPPGCFNPWLNATVCHCGRIWHAGEVPLDRWPDRDARNTAHILVAVS